MTQLKLYAWGTPNGLKPVLMLEELGTPYELVKVNIGSGAQKTPEFHAKNENERIPVLETEVDGKTVTISESAAILVHLAETHGGRFLPATGAARAAAFQWTFFQMAAIGPMFGQTGFWKRREPKNEEAITRYLTESQRIYGVLDERLGKVRYLAGEEYSIADMATLFWTRRPDFFGLSLDTWPNVKRWVTELDARPAVKATLAITWP